MIPGIRSALTRHIEQHNLTTTDIANAVGISRAHVSRILSGGNASTKVWRKLLNHCNLTIEVAPMPGAGGRLFEEDARPNRAQPTHEFARVHNGIDATVPNLTEEPEPLTLESLEQRIQALENARISERQPWHDAPAGGIWDVTIRGHAVPLRMIVQTRTSGKVFQDLSAATVGRVSIVLDSPQVISAVKVFDPPGVHS